LDSLKNQEILVDAAAILLKEKYLDFHLLLIGDETDSITGKDYRQTLMNKINDYSINNYVSFFGFTNEIENFFEVMDVFVLPTDKESFGYVLIEAMANGKPVIASNQGGPKEIINDGENGFLFEAKNKIDLTNKIEKLILDKNLREKMSKRSKEIAYSKYDIKTTIDSYLDLFKQLVLNE
jgi:L-malate glycosyltransferase